MGSSRRLPAGSGPGAPSASARRGHPGARPGSSLTLQPRASRRGGAQQEQRQERAEHRAPRGCRCPHAAGTAGAERRAAAGRGGAARAGRGRRCRRGGNKEPSITGRASRGPRRVLGHGGPLAAPPAERSTAGRGAPGPGLRATHRPPWRYPPLARLPLTEIECGRRRFTGRSGSLGPPSRQPEPPQQRRSIPARESCCLPAGRRQPTARRRCGAALPGHPGSRCQPPGQAEPPGLSLLPGQAGEERTERSQPAWRALSGINQHRDPAQAPQ